MLRVIVESPFAPQTPLDTRSCMHASTCAEAYKIYGEAMGWCANCLALRANANVRRDELARNIRYARAALRDCLLAGEAPYASHLLYTQDGVLDDTIPAQRANGIEAGYEWWAHAHIVAFYIDLGFSPGMLRALERAAHIGMTINVRRIEGWK